MDWTLKYQTQYFYNTTSLKLRLNYLVDIALYLSQTKLNVFISEMKWSLYSSKR